MSEPYDKIYVVDSSDVSKTVFKDLTELGKTPYLFAQGETFNYAVLGTDVNGIILKFNTPTLLNDIIWDPINFTFTPNKNGIYQINISFLYDFYTEDATSPPYDARFEFVLYRNGSPQTNTIYKVSGFSDIPLVINSASRDTPITLSYVKELFAGNVYFLLIKPSSTNNTNSNLLIKKEAGNLNVSYICNNN